MSEIKGLSELVAAFQNPGPEEIIARALRSATDVVRVEVRYRATPELAGALVVSTEQEETWGQSLIGFSQDVSERTGKPLDAIAEWIELGHVMETHDGKQVGHVPAYPFIRPAVDTARQPAIEAFTESFQKDLPILFQVKS